jgi:hypothetical protein
MTEVRTQLRSARQAYRRARYPGDLAAELLPRPARLATFFASRRWVFASGVGAGVAAALLLSLLLTRSSPIDYSEPARTPSQGIANWLPLGPEKVPLPRFEAPSLPVRPPQLHFPLQVPPGVEAYQDLAMQYRELQLQEHLRKTTVPTIPVDLPTRGVEWLHKVWSGDKSA